jgi:hypothetical protein
MATKVFGSEVLTVSDTNTYLANSGLVYVTSATIGSAVSSVTLSSCFNSTYTAYKVIVAGGTTSADAALALKLGASATGYYASKPFMVYSTAGFFAGTDNNAASFTQSGFSISGQGMSLNVDLQNPFLAQYTYMQGSVHAATLGGLCSGVHQVATSYSAITVTPSAGTMTGGTITVYGYRLG